VVGVVEGVYSENCMLIFLELVGVYLMYLYFDEAMITIDFIGREN
jgi:hypothetical protein